MKAQWLLAALLLVPSVVLAEDAAEEKMTEQKSEGTYERARMEEDRTDAQQASEIISRSTEAYNDLMTKQQGAEAKQLKDAAKCIAVFPGVRKAALLVGGTAGDGVAACRTGENEWSKVSFLDIVGASLGAQLGTTSTDMVVFFNSEDAAQRLKDGTMSFGADLQAAWGENVREIAAEIGGKDVVILSSASGAFAGASLEGTRIDADHSRNKTFYQQDMKSQDILTASGMMEGKGAQEFISALETK